MSADDRRDPADRAEPSAETETEIEGADEAVSPRRRIGKVLVRALIMAVGLVVAGVALRFAFDDISLSEVVDAIRGLDDAETIALIAGTVGVIWAEALLTASVVEGLPARRGALAWLGPTAVASVIPGPSDMPLRYRMFGSWGYDAATAGTAVAASALLNIGLKLVLPAIAGIGIAVADIPLRGFFSTIVTAAVMLGVFLAIAAFVLGTEQRTAAAGRALDRIWNPTLRLLRRETSGPALADRLVTLRERSLDQLRGRWPYSVASLGMVTVTRVALFVMCIRFAGVPEEAAGWPAIFCVWAIVRGLTLIPIMPGNAGVSELAFVAMLTPIAGTDYVNQVTAGVLLFRLLTWLLLIPAGGAAIGLWQLGLQRSARARASA